MVYCANYPIEEKSDMVCMSGIDVLGPLVNTLLILIRLRCVALRWQFKRSLDNLYTCNISTASQKKSRMHA
jgi:hypothetical protein